MTEVIGHCHDCHEDISVDALQVTLISYAESSVVSFLCPMCGFPQSRTLTGEVLDAFRQTAGHKIAMPAQEQHQGGPITLDERIDLGRWITEQEG